MTQAPALPPGRGTQDPLSDLTAAGMAARRLMKPPIQTPTWNIWLSPGQNASLSFDVPPNKADIEALTEYLELIQRRLPDEPSPAPGPASAPQSPEVEDDFNR